MDWVKSKFFWLNLIGIIILVVQYLINNQLLTDYAVYEGLAIIVLNAIAGAITSNQNVQLKKTLAKLNKQIQLNR